MKRKKRESIFSYINKHRKISFGCFLLTVFVFFSPLLAWSTKIRIVSLAPSLTQSIYYLEAQDQLVGCTSYCTAAQADKKEVVASAVMPNLEKIVALKPDLVIVAGFTSEKDLSTLRKLNIKIEIFPSPKSFEDICIQFEKLGKLIGKDTKAQSIVKLTRQKAKQIKARFPKTNTPPKIFIQIGASPIFSVLQNTFMHDYITFCGGVNIAPNLKGGIIGREFVVACNPDYIFVVTMGMAGEDEIKNWSQFTQLKAIKNKRIFAIDANKACEPTPITFIETLETIANYMDPSYSP